MIPYKTKQNNSNLLLELTSNFYAEMDKRRSVRFFSDKPVDRAVIENIILTASTAPSGAHKQPWTFCCVSNPDMKRQIRIAAEQEEKINYESRMSDEWKEDLSAFETNWEKPFIETAPWIIVVFKRSYEWKQKADGSKYKHQNYYVTESCGIACGMLITAIHHAGLCTLTHTPSPMNFLSKILQRPEEEKPFLLLPVGYAADDCKVPDLNRKSMEAISVWY